jgi:hypothetical protein
VSVQTKVALDKQKHPERFCPVPGCLWKTSKLDHVTQTFSRDPKYPTGYCPRHLTYKGETK